MAAFLKKSVKISVQSINNFRQQNAAPAIGQSMIDRHTCPCCSDVLLRHVHSGHLYWRCGHCYQNMPV